MPRSHATEELHEPKLIGGHNKPKPPHGRALTLVLCGIAAGIYEGDALLIAAVAQNLAERFELSISGIGSLMMVRAFIQAFLMPLWGYMADRTSRKKLLSLGVFLWGLDALLLSGCQKTWQLLVVRGLAGIGLSAVPPVAHSIVSDLYAPEDRGNAFGWIGFSMIMGGSFGTLFGVNVGSVDKIMGITGWRFMFLSVAVLALILAVVMYYVGIDPPRGTMEPGYDPDAPIAVNEDGEEINPHLLNENHISLGASIKALFAIPTFVLLFLRSSFDGIPSNANSLFILWYEYLGFEESEASYLVTLMYSSAAVSSLGGGIIADWLMRRAQVKLDVADEAYEVAHARVGEARRAEDEALQAGAPAGDAHERLLEAEAELEEKDVERNDAMQAMNMSRIMFAQSGAALAMIFCILHFKVGPKTKYMGGDTPLDEALWWFLPIGLLMNLCGNWDEQACDLPLMSYVVPPEIRGTGFGAMTMTQTFWAFLATAMVGIMAEYGFHFHTRAAEHPVEEWSDQVRVENVRALGSAIMTVDVIALAASVLVYLGVQFTYPRDREKMMATMRERNSTSAKTKLLREQAHAAGHGDGDGVHTPLLNGEGASSDTEDLLPEVSVADINRGLGGGIGAEGEAEGAGAGAGAGADDSV